MRPTNRYIKCPKRDIVNEISILKDEYLGWKLGKTKMGVELSHIGGKTKVRGVYKHGVEKNLQASIHVLLQHLPARRGVPIVDFVDQNRETCAWARDLRTRMLLRNLVRLHISFCPNASLNPSLVHPFKFWRCYGCTLTKKNYLSSDGEYGGPCHRENHGSSAPGR